MSNFSFEQDPLLSFQSELQRASQVIAKDPNAMSLATVSTDGKPSLRTVLFKGMVRGGLSFYTNYESQKSQELSKNSQAALLFYWNVLALQIRFEGSVFQLTRAESEAYFRTRPRLSQAGAWASKQSRVIQSKEELEAEVTAIEEKYAGKEIPCPPFWGGWHLIPDLIEFWYGQEGRLHDRYVFTRDNPQASWQRCMKSP